MVCSPRPLTPSAASSDEGEHAADRGRIVTGEGAVQHHLRDPNRDHQHGRIYRVTYPSRPLLTPKKIAGEPIDPDRHILDHEVKAATRHGLSVRRAGPGWIAEVILDI